MGMFDRYAGYITCTGFQKHEGKVIHVEAFFEDLDNRKPPKVQFLTTFLAACHCLPTDASRCVYLRYLQVHSMSSILW